MKEQKVARVKRFLEVTRAGQSTREGSGFSWMFSQDGVTVVYPTETGYEKEVFSWSELEDCTYGLLDLMRKNAKQSVCGVAGEMLE